MNIEELYLYLGQLTANKVFFEDIKPLQPPLREVGRDDSLRPLRLRKLNYTKIH